MLSTRWHQHQLHPLARSKNQKSCLTFTNIHVWPKIRMLTVIKVSGSTKIKPFESFCLYQFLRKIPVPISYNSHLWFVIMMIYALAERWYSTTWLMANPLLIILTRVHKRGLEPAAIRPGVKSNCHLTYHMCWSKACKFKFLTIVTQFAKVA